MDQLINNVALLLLFRRRCHPIPSSPSIDFDVEQSEENKEQGNYRQEVIIKPAPQHIHPRSGVIRFLIQQVSKLLGHSLKCNAAEEFAAVTSLPRKWIMAI
jgi:hypothetical protein